jgi:Cu(I)/Ag(I) efflux system membrane fusion protein/cobalt-zinc-cadmium efflux system membrane fusion protein
MHPQIIEKQPGDCPICGMDLVQSEPEAETHDHTAGKSRSDQGPTVRIDPVVVQNMNVTTEPVDRRDVTRRIRTVGSLQYDLEGMVTVTTRYSGFVEKVHVGNVGESVRAGDPLFDVYAPALVQTQQELLSAIRYAESLSNAPDEARHRAHELVNAARTRLGYWNLTDEQIRSIEQNAAVQRTITVFAPISGVIMERAHGLDGMAISPGMDVIHIADLSTLLLTVEVFEDQLQWVSIGTKATIHMTYLGDEPLQGRVRFIEPEVVEQTRTVRLLVEVPNRRGRLRVGMYANVEFEPVMAKDAIVIPAQAVLRTGERDVVVIALGDGMFAPREVELGLEGDDGYVQVTSGISEYEVVVTSAQFLIDSESNLRAAISKMTAANHLGH